MKNAIKTLLLASILLLASCENETDPKTLPYSSKICITHVDKDGYMIDMDKEKNLINVISFKRFDKDLDYIARPNDAIDQYEETAMLINIDFSTYDMVQSEGEAEYTLKWKTSISDEVYSLELILQGQHICQYSKDFLFNGQKINCIAADDFTYYNNEDGNYYIDADKFDSLRNECFENVDGIRRYKGGMEPIAFINDSTFYIYIPIDTE